jgi:molybdopterin-containing oxidoreductase family membrane subunit
MARLVGIFELPGQTAAAVKQLRGRGYTDIETYAPAPFPEVEDAVHPKPSRVRLLTLIGGLVGVVTGYAMTIWMANDWQIMIGGKPFSSIPPFTIIAFELTILFGGVLTVLGLFIFGKLPKFKLDPAYSRRFSAEEFGVVVRCREQDVTEIDALLRANDATEVNLVES